ncbi:unnamed protein product [Withania somnifera]
MEVDTGNSCFIKKLPVERYTSTRETKKPPETNKSTPVFVNHAAVAWHENRRKWVGEASNKSERMQKDPIISFTKFLDLLSCIPSTRYRHLEMVDFLVDIWHVEGLFD